MNSFENVKKNLKFDIFENDINNNFYITSTRISKLINNNKIINPIENEKNKINKSKNNFKRNKSSFIFPKKLKSLDEIIMEKEIKFENKYMKSKSLRKYLNCIYKNELKYARKIFNDDNDKYISIKSDFEKLTKSSEKREKTNLSKLKEYSSFKNIFKKSYKDIINLEKEIHKLRERQYISTNSYDTLTKYQKYLISSKNNIFYEKGKEKTDLFTISLKTNKINKLEGLVAYKNRNFLANQLGFKLGTKYIYKKNKRKLKF